MKTALITGASSGIGYELAHVFARHGHNLVLVARRWDKLEALAEQLKATYQVDVIVISKDLRLPKAPQNIYAELKNQNISIDFLVNNAGFGNYGFFTETDWEGEYQMLQVNIAALTHLTKLFVPDMVKQGSGRVLNVASTAAFQPGPLMAVYFATKAYVLSFSEAIANELSGSGVTVTALCPGPTHSGFLETAALGDSRLFKGKKLPSSREVAEFGYQAMLKGRRVAIHGTFNWLLANSVRITPRSWITAIVRKMAGRVSS